MLPTGSRPFPARLRQDTGYAVYQQQTDDSTRGMGTYGCKYPSRSCVIVSSTRKGRSGRFRKCNVAFSEACIPKTGRTHAVVYSLTETAIQEGPTISMSLKSRRRIETGEVPENVEVFDLDSGEDEQIRLFNYAYHCRGIPSETPRTQQCAGMFRHSFDKLFPSWHCESSGAR